MMRLLLALAALLTAPTATQASAQTDLDAARAKWADQKVADYTFKVSRSCFCPREYTRTYTMYVRDGEPYEPVRYVREYASVERLFAVVQKAIDGDGTVTASYGPTGAPKSISLDPIPEAIDDESAITVSAPKPIRTFFDVADVTIRDGSAARELREARKRWGRTGLTDYRYKVRYSCFCANTEPFPVTVRDGESEGKAPSVLDLFDVIGRAIRKDSADLRVRYTKSGRPATIYVDPSQLTADDEIGTTTRKPRPL